MKNMDFSLTKEQEMLKKQAYKAKIIVTKDGELITYTEYKKIMER